MPAKRALLLRKQVWAQGGTEHLSMVHQATVQPYRLLWVGYYQSHQVVKFAQKKSIITINLSEIKIWVTPPAKLSKPTDVLANEKGVLQRAEEKGDTDEQTAAAVRSWLTNLHIVGFL